MSSIEPRSNPDETYREQRRREIRREEVTVENDGRERQRRCDGERCERAMAGAMRESYGRRSCGRSYGHWSVVVSLWPELWRRDSRESLDARMREERLRGSERLRSGKGTLLL